MKKNISFTIGVATGALTLMAAVPLLAQMSSAASSASQAPKTRPVSTQACVQALANEAGAELSAVDTRNAAEKTAMQTHKDALTTAAAITDNTQRQTALQKAETDFRTAMKATMDTYTTALKPTMDAVKSTCGNQAGTGFQGTMKGPGNPHMMTGNKKGIWKGKGMMHNGKGTSSSAASVQ